MRVGARLQPRSPPEHLAEAQCGHQLSRLATAARLATGAWRASSLFEANAGNRPALEAVAGEPRRARQQHVMQLIHHRLGIWISRLLKVVGPPTVILPIAPVLHNVVERYTPLPILGNRAEHLGLSVETLTALPEPIRPPRQHHGLPGDEPVTTYHIISVRTGN